MYLNDCCIMDSLACYPNRHRLAERERKPSVYSMVGTQGLFFVLEFFCYDCFSVSDLLYLCLRRFKLNNVLNLTVKDKT